jgi:lipoate-protein ligase A
MIRCRILPYFAAAGPANMALDHALLDSVDADCSQAVLRTYGWIEPTLSLGYFQPIAAVRNSPAWAEVPVVRRPSGGGAIWHEHELTYSIVIPRTHPLASRPTSLYRAIHAFFIRQLTATGHIAQRRADAAGALVVSPSPESARPFLCFQDNDPEDVLIARHKTVGSAQRRRPAAVLQHGSLRFAASSRTANLPGLNLDVEAVSTARTEWTERICRALPGELGLHPVPSQLHTHEREHARHAELTFYGTTAWTTRR